MYRAFKEEDKTCQCICLFHGLYQSWSYLAEESNNHVGAVKFSETDSYCQSLGWVAWCDAPSHIDWNILVPRLLYGQKSDASIWYKVQIMLQAIMQRQITTVTVDHQIWKKSDSFKQYQIVTTREMVVQIPL